MEEDMVVGCAVATSEVPPSWMEPQQRACSVCGRMCWLSRASLAEMAKRPLKVWCLDCAVPYLGRAEEVCIPPGAVEDAVRATDDPEGVRDVVEALTGKRPADG